MSEEIINETMNQTLNYTQMYIDQVMASTNRLSILIVTIIISIAIISFLFIKIRKNKQRKQDIKNQKEILLQIEEAHKKLEEKGRQIKWCGVIFPHFLQNLFMVLVCFHY